MHIIPSAIVFVNNDLTGNVQEAIVKQLFIDIVLTGDEFDGLVNSDSGYVDYIHQTNKRALVIRPFNELHNRDLADIAIFVSNGLASVECRNNGPPGITLPVSNLYYGQINYF